MKFSLKTLPPAALLILGLGIGHGFAGEHQAGAIAWSGVDVQSGSNQTACVAESAKDLAVAAAVHIATPQKAVLVIELSEFPTGTAGSGAGRKCAPLTLVTRTH